MSDLVRNPRGAVTQAIALASRDDLITSVIVAGELKTWVAKNRSVRLAALVEATLAAIPALPLEPAVAGVYAKLRADLERVGTPIGGNDLWIACHAMALNAAVVSDNEREFRRVPGLPVYNWLRA